MQIHIHMWEKHTLLCTKEILLKHTHNRTTLVHAARLEGLDSICNKHLRNQRFGGENFKEAASVATVTQTTPT